MESIHAWKEYMHGRKTCMGETRTGTLAIEKKEHKVLNSSNTNLVRLNRRRLRIREIFLSVCVIQPADPQGGRI